MPFGVRAARPALICGSSAATRRRATSLTAPVSPAGGEVIVSRGMRTPVCGTRALLHVVVYHQHHRPHGRRHSEFVGPNGGFGEVAQRSGFIVPLDVIADHRRHILSAVVRIDAVCPRAAVHPVADDDVDRHPVGVGVVDRHRGVLQSDDAVQHRHHRLALDLGEAMRHGHRRLFVAAGQQLRHLVAAVVDDGFVQAFEARAWIRSNVLEAERLDARPP